MTYNDTKLTDWDAGVRPMIEKINARWPTIPWGTYNGHHPTKGRATDGMVSARLDKKTGDALAKWLWDNRRALGIWYVIWNGRIISRTYEAAGWRTYYPTAAAIKASRDSAFHYNHVHVSFNELSAPPVYLPVYLVDPEQVSTFMVANATKPGQDDKMRQPLFRITTGVRIDTRQAADGKVTKWLVTDAGYDYYLPFLVLESEYQKRPPRVEKPEDAVLTKIEFATFNILGDAAGKKGGEGSLASRLPKIVASIKASKASVLALQECNLEAAGLVQAELGPSWVWSRVGTRTVMVNRDVWEFGKERKVEMIGKHSGDDKSFPVVVCKHKVSGAEVAFASVHFSSTTANKDVATSEQMAAERADQARAVAGVANDYNIFVGGGDLNSSSSTKGKPKPILQAAGLRLMTLDPTFDSVKVDSFPNKTPGGQQIDDVFIKGARFLDGDIIEGKGSDHNLLDAYIELEK